MMVAGYFLRPTIVAVIRAYNPCNVRIVEQCSSCLYLGAVGYYGEYRQVGRLEQLSESDITVRVTNRT